ncbi:flap endonuclease 1-A-like [Phoenix dactylifera]|uniref:Flap endonuclease 1-A-like n=1 Tax=Phoenix dactylifera TaxID=42345 RepID=A0A8B8ZHA0_PHODC|nr:flap endonuclease 1-A-like [Phoenix dactylifera]
MVISEENDPPWVFLAAYASKDYRERKVLWDEATSLIPQGYPVMVVGEFNCIDGSDERRGRKPSSTKGLVDFLVKDNGFNHDRVIKAIEKIKAAKNKSSQGRLESFFKPVVSASMSLKRKETAEKVAKEARNKKSKTRGGKK